MNKLEIKKAELIIAYRQNHITWKKLLEEIDRLQLEALEN